MATYRIYCMNGAGQIGLADWIQAEDDEDAIRQARTFKSGTLKCEVWLGTRLVRSLANQELRSVG